MICIYWLKNVLCILWEDGVKDFLDFFFYVLISIGAIMMGMGFLFVDIILSPLELTLYIIWVIIKVFKRGGKT